jgi:hypothetical protein
VNHYLVLLQMGFALPALLPRPRCALTAPFHPYQLPGGLFSVALSMDESSRRYLASLPLEPGLSSEKNSSSCLIGTL